MSVFKKFINTALASAGFLAGTSQNLHASSVNDDSQAPIISIAAVQVPVPKPIVKFDSDWSSNEKAVRKEFWSICNAYYGTPWDEPFLELDKLVRASYELGNKEVDTSMIDSFVRALRVARIKLNEIPAKIKERQDQIAGKTKSSISQDELKKRLEANERMKMYGPLVIDFYTKYFQIHTGVKI